jgi:uncharacterized cupin superfamily protein
MSIADVRTISLESSTPFVPAFDPADVPQGARWVETEHRCFEAADGRLFGGLWEGEPGALRLVPYPYDEVCVMLEGRVALVDEAGGRREFGAGEAFFVPRSFAGTWETLEPSRKIFVALAEEPAR